MTRLAKSLACPCDCHLSKRSSMQLRLSAYCCGASATSSKGCGGNAPLPGKPGTGSSAAALLLQSSDQQSHVRDMRLETLCTTSKQQRLLH